jgi:hypothetical protein
VVRSSPPWARRFITALRNADARVIGIARVPADAVAQALEEEG